MCAGGAEARPQSAGLDPTDQEWTRPDRPERKTDRGDRRRAEETQHQK